MKKILIILAVVSLAGCKTENIYLTILPIKKVTETDTIYVVPDNRFKRELEKADSIFSIIDKASDAVAKSAFEKTKHLLPQWYKRKYID
ncbi:hypothetical protein [Bacteroides thetaiotaomicron]|jgi:hypothetical protein|uniref:Lipoprotein n=1 Tax=Bacteroides thetaiotaomicron TaxID=818 RepID=A0A414HVA6_BACT4|nr:hypothetical protein [Bacteroides thetaiotaomicron]MBL3928742.1 hypothetical protein [Bacteroides thetaiotaomicron]MBL3952854.1 hypothetical protein [Bacteroides thetaiotaomicron]RHD91623.1 hypothetical protein DW780_01065 [Bacteroides thetaiotaomicron]